MTASSRLSAGLLLAVLTATWVAAGRSVPAAPAGPAAPPLTVSAPYTHDNLAVYVVRGPDEFDAGNLMTLQEALDRGLAVVHETGNVNQLAVENLSDDRELFLQSGDIVKGGRQDRLIASDMVLPPKSGKVACPANCCEHSRWTGRGAEAAHRFEASTDFAVGNAIKIANATHCQGEVWSNVAEAQKKLSENVGKTVTAAASPTSLQLALEDKDLRARLAGYESALAGVAGYRDAVGVVVAVNGKVIAADVYGSAKLFKKVWPKLLKAAAADALAQLPEGDLPPAPSVKDAETFLASAAGAADRQSQEPPGNLTLVEVNVEPAVRAAMFANQNTAVFLPPTYARTVPTGFGGRQSGFGESSNGRNRVYLAEEVPAPAPEARAQSLPELGLIVNRASSQAVPTQVPTPLPIGNGMPSATLGRPVVTAAGANRASNVQFQAALGDNLNSMNPQTRAASATPDGIVVVESQAPAKPGVTVHRSYLKK